jgi:hypothetical protein
MSGNNSNNIPTNEFCRECNKPNTFRNWCQPCNAKRFQQDFHKWTSGNEFIDKFIQKSQLNAKWNYDVIEWIPYNRLKNIKYLDKGGFSTVYKAIWLDGYINRWDYEKQQWQRTTREPVSENFAMKHQEVALKSLDNSSDNDNSSDLNDEFLKTYEFGGHTFTMKLYEVVLKVLDNSSDLNNDFLKEVIILIII